MAGPAIPTLFGDFNSSLDSMLVTGMDGVISGGLASMRGQIAAALSLYIIGFAFLTIYGKTDVGTAALAAVRAMVVTQILQASAYTYYVRDFFFTDAPNTIAAALGGPGSSVTSVQQFDVLWSAALNATAIVLGQATGFTMMAERAVAWVLAGGMLAALGVIYLVWVISRVFMAVVIAMGVFIVLLFLFRSTRGFVEQWIGKLVGLLVLQLTSSILLRMILVIITDKMRVMGAAPSGDVTALLGQLASVAGVFGLAAALMVVLPSFIAIGSGVGAGSVIAGGVIGRLAAGGRAATPTGGTLRPAYRS